MLDLWCNQLLSLRYGLECLVGLTVHYLVETHITVLEQWLELLLVIVLLLNIGWDGLLTGNKLRVMPSLLHLIGLVIKILLIVRSVLLRYRKTLAIWKVFYLSWIRLRLLSSNHQGGSRVAASVFKIDEGFLIINGETCLFIFEIDRIDSSTNFHKAHLTMTNVLHLVLTQYVLAWGALFHKFNSWVFIKRSSQNWRVGIQRLTYVIRASTCSHSWWIIYPDVTSRALVFIVGVLAWLMTASNSTSWDFLSLDLVVAVWSSFRIRIICRAAGDDWRQDYLLLGAGGLLLLELLCIIKGRSHVVSSGQV